MPEGDTLFRIATVLRDALAGEPVLRCAVSRVRFRGEEIEGRRVERVEARGKNLLISLSEDRVLHTHLGLHGSWHLYAAGAPWRKPLAQCRVALETSRHVAACFNASRVDLLDAFALRGARSLVALGPDLLDPAVDLREARRRIRAAGELEIGDALLRQSLVAGIGNVYKSEVLFVRRIDPFAKVRQLDDATIDGLLAEAQALLRANTGGGPRITRRSAPLGARGLTLRDRYWVYRRSGRPCPRCAAPIARRRQGEAGRSTYYCPSCQRPERRDLSRAEGP